MSVCKEGVLKHCEIVDDVIREMQRQRKLRDEGKFDATAGDLMATGAWYEMFPILVEEVGEAARAMNERDGANLREELVQIAAVAISALHGMEAYNRRD